MSFRTLKFGDKVGQVEPQLEEAILLEVYTKCPSKWKLIDEETGEVYRGWNHEDDPANLHWKKEDNNIKTEIDEI